MSQNDTTYLNRQISPGERVVYWRGFLAQSVPTAFSAQQSRIWAMGEHDAGRAILLQRKIGNGQYEYIAIGRQEPIAPKKKKNLRAYERGY